MATEWKTLKEVVDELNVSLPRLRSWTKKGLVKSMQKNYRCYIPETEYPKIERIIDLFAEGNRQNKRMTIAEVKEQLKKENLLDISGNVYEQHTSEMSEDQGAEMNQHLSQMLKDISENSVQMQQDITYLRQQFEDLQRKIDLLFLPQAQTASSAHSPSEPDYQSEVEKILKKEAQELWDQKPRKERMTGIGFLKFKEDKQQKEKFISLYMNQNYKKRYKQLLQSLSNA